MKIYNTKRSVTRGSIIAIVLLVSQVFAAEQTVANLSKISTISKNQIEALNAKWEDSPNIGIIVISDEIIGLASEYQTLLDNGGATAIAKRLLNKYSTDSASSEMAAAALALGADAGYFQKRSPLDKQMFRSKKQDSAKLLKNAKAVFDGLLAGGALENRMAAAEFILQLESEGLVCLTNMSGNGGRKTDLMPHDVTALVVPLLEDKDPFVQALAEWAVSVAVCNANDQERAKAFPVDGQGTPDWFAKYMAVPVEKHLPYDYIRQAVTLGMHRRPADIAKLSEDVTRRAKERAAWVKEHGGDAASVDQAVKAMDSALTSFKQNATTNSETMHEQYLTWRKSVRDVVINGPDMDFDSLVFIKRWNAKSHLEPGVHSASQFPDGGDIYLQKGLDPDSELVSIVGDKLQGGFGSGMDIWYGGDRILFSWKPGGKRIQKLYEINIDGTGLKAVTDGPFDDVEPSYLADGEFVFASTRGEVGIMCHGSSGLGSIPSDGSSGTFSGLHTNIYRTLNDHKEVRRLSYCKDNDAYPEVLNDGRIVWMRWDYQERDVNEIFSLWVMYPDGSGSDAFHKVHIKAKKTIQALRDSKAIEGSEMLVSTGGGHYNYTEGTIVLHNPSLGINEPNSFWNIVPHSSPVLYGWGDLAAVKEGGVPYVGGYYCKPHGLTEKSFIVSAGYDQPQSNNFQVYYIDVWGNKELIQRDKLYETVCALPVEKREFPTHLPDRSRPEMNHATLYLEDVYADLPGVDKGEVKYLRILQMIHWIKEAGENGVQYHPQANASECFAFGGNGGPIRTVGIVPVNGDGAAYFEVPAKADLYFQALDKDYRALQRMRTHVEFAPGEFRGCVACHETRSVTSRPSKKAMSDALKTKAVRPTPPPWGENTLLDYEKHIQPIFNDKCIKCHAGKPDQGWLDLSDKRDRFGFMQGYRALFGLKADDETPDVQWSVTDVIDRRKVKLPRSHEHPWWNVMFEDIYVRGKTEGVVTEPRQFGAVKHPLMTKLLTDEKHSKLLTEEQKQMMSNFFDIQAPYFSTFRQKVRRDMIQVILEPYAPFGESRNHKIHHGEDVTPKLDAPNSSKDVVKSE